MSRSTLKAVVCGAIPLFLFPFLLHAGAGKAPQQSRGEKVFAANCSRCHAPPMNLPPRITGTILMHMRTRARLSREDEQALLHFMAPK